MKHIPIAIFAFFSLLTLFVSFVFNYDISGGGSTSDFETHWKYIKILNSDLNNLFNIELGKDLFLQGFDKQMIGVKKNEKKKMNRTLQKFIAIAITAGVAFSTIAYFLLLL